MVMLFSLLFRWQLVATGDIRQLDIEMAVDASDDAEMYVGRYW